jgi:hypothetical protein
VRTEAGFIIVVVAIIMLIVGIDHEVGGEQQNNEPYVGLCTDPTTQGGC